MDDKVLQAALAGLLHDIGKFAQRAGEQVSAEWSEGRTQADFGYQHALHTWHFVNKYLPEAFKQAGAMAAFHHRPNEAGKLIQAADHLSAGERADEVKDDENRKSHPRQMLSVFSSLYRNDKPAELYLPLAALRLEKDAIFPKAAIPETEAWKSYESMWREFCAEAEALKKTHEAHPDLESYLEAMLGLLQRYTWSIPSAYYKTRPDVSLYDHSRMTAALAAIMSQSAGERKENEPVALLVGGDISGVQDFIYTIASKGAAKTLRGRSFYLQLLTEAALRFVLRQLGLPYTNVIYSGGGNFFLLAHPGAKDQLPAIRARLSQTLLSHHGTALYLALGCAEISGDGFTPGNLPTHWNEMHRAVNLAKQQRYTELGEAAQPSVFTPAEFGGNPEQTCSVCGNDQLKTQEWDAPENPERVCSFCASFKEIGEDLPRSQFIALGWKEPVQNNAGTAQEALAALGLEFELLKAGQTVSLSADRLTLWAMNDVAGKWPVTRVPAAHFLRYVTNLVPNATLDELQDEVGGGFRKLGVLRLDVDNVGEMFKHGLGDLATLSRIAALSSQMSLFFEGWLKKICERDERRERIYTVYTGGDDAFLLGPWDLIPALAQEIAGEFGEYTGRHPKMSLSAGMSFIGGKYPIYQAAKDAEEALEDAKQSGKDAFHFLGESWKWKIFAELAQKQARLEKIVASKEDGGLGGPKALLGTLRQLAQDADAHKDGNSRHVWGRWIWLGTYQLLRMVDRSKGPQAEQIEKIKQDLQTSNYQDINQWGTAARWTQLKTRKSTKEEQL